LLACNCEIEAAAAAGQAFEDAADLLFQVLFDEIQV
jgi:hypothetical protein